MPEPQLTGARILIVDDEEANVRLLERLLAKAGYANLTAMTDPRRVLTEFGQVQPDLILLDLRMPHIDGFAVLTLLGPRIPAGSYLPVLVLTADITREAKQRALVLGAADFLTKPFDPIEVLLRIKNLLRTRALHLRLQDQNAILESRVRERTRELEAARFELLERLALAIEFRDDETHEHTLRVGRTSALLAKAMELPEADVELIWRAAPLHDIGKIGIPNRILLKPGRLTAEEFADMKAHTTIGAELLANGRSALVLLAAQIARTHHERWDGSGYPDGLRGSEIPLAARIVSVTDVFDALTHVRPYKQAWLAEAAVAEIERQSGRQFDPEVVERFVRVLPSVLEIRSRSA